MIAREEYPDGRAFEVVAGDLLKDTSLRTVRLCLFAGPLVELVRSEMGTEGRSRR